MLRRAKWYFGKLLLQFVLLLARLRHSVCQLENVMNVIPESLPDAYAAARRQMVDRHLAGRDITDRRVIAALVEVPREHFVSAGMRVSAYDDTPLPIGRGQTISQP